LWRVGFAGPAFAADELSVDADGNDGGTFTATGPDETRHLGPSTGHAIPTGPARPDEATNASQDLRVDDATATINGI
jgi:hypothetical protein